jgi:glycosyltransferase involved in cell wall biosynthesis
MPAFNEESNIQQTIDAWSPIFTKVSGSKLLVINDGSKDKTGDILKDLASKYNFLEVIDKPNEGHGKTIYLGYKKAIEKKHEWVFQTDGDGHFDPDDFYKLWSQKDSSHFLLGNRTKRKDPAVRVVLSNLISLWIYLLFGHYIKDSNVPFRLIRTSYLKKILKKVPKGVFAPNIFLSILAKKDGQNLHHIPVSHYPRKKQNSTFKLLKGGFVCLFELLVFSLSVVG